MGIQIQQGSVNTASLGPPGITIGIIPPIPQVLNGVPTNIGGLVGTASYGPVNTAVAGTLAALQAAFGQQINRVGDLVTAAAATNQQGVNSFIGVRVTDGTDTAATANFGISGAAYAALFAARETGSAGNAFTIVFQKSSYPAAYKAVLTSGIGAPEVFDNITTASPAAFWTALVNAVNNGTGLTRGRSVFFVGSLGTNTTATIPALVNGVSAALTLTGGTDGVTFGTGTLMNAQIGANGAAGSRTGMYVLTGSGASAATLVDAYGTAGVSGGSFTFSDTAQWSVQLAFGLANGIYMVTASQPGDSIGNWLLGNAAGAGSNGAAGYGLKAMFGDWVYWNDTVNNTLRLLSPATFAMGRLLNQAPNLSALNKPIYGISSTQGSQANTVYAQQDIQALMTAGLDIITPPGQGASDLPIWSCAIGNNTNYVSGAQGDDYTMMTNYIVDTMASVAGLSQFLGQVITPDLLRQEQAVLDAYFQVLVDNDLIGGPIISDPTTGQFTEGPAFQNTVISTGPQLAAGITVFSSQVVYLAVQRNIAVQYQGGATVQITVQSTAPGQ